MRYKVKHVTEYTYQEPVNTCINRLCLTPITQPHHECVFSEIKISPEPDEFTYRTDYFGNTILFFSTYKEHLHLEITSTSEVNIENRSMDAITTSSVLWTDVRALISNGTDNIVEYALPSFYIPVSEEIRDFSADCFVQGETLFTACDKLMKKIFTTIEFKPGFTTVNTPVETVIKAKKGVCQDFAHLMIACLRSHGLPARYVSGYLETVPPPGKKKLVGADASHAWVSVYFPEIGWVEFDPTNNIIPSDKHIIVAYGRDYQDVAPIKGIVFSSGKQELDVKVDVERIDEYYVSN
jgi:transglutaminase-like putative cysteine protease